MQKLAIEIVVRGFLLLFLWNQISVLAAEAKVSATGSDPAGGVGMTLNPGPPGEEPGNSRALYQRFDVQIEFRDDGTCEEKRQVSVQVQSLEGLQYFQQLYIPFHGALQKVKIERLQTVKSDGRVFPASTREPMEITRPQGVLNYNFTDDKVKVLPTVSLQAGDRLEYEVSLKTTKPLKAGDFWMTYSPDRQFPIARGEVTVSWPARRQVLIKSDESFPHRLESKGNRVLHHWSLQDLPARERSRLEKPLFSLSTLESWNGMGQWYRSLLSDAMELTPGLKEAARKLLEGKAGAREKLQAIYYHVSREIRYLSLSFGKGGVQPHRAQDVWKNQYGDCKDKHALFAALLSFAGIPCYAGLISSDIPIDREVPNPEQFDHVISVVPLDGQWYWLDTTLELAPLGFIARELRGKQSLVVMPGESRWISVPLQSQVPEQWKFRAVGSVDGDGTLQVRFSSEKRGQYEMWARSYYAKAADASGKEPNYDDRYPHYGNEKAEVVARSDPYDFRLPFQVEVISTVPRFVEALRKRQEKRIPTRVLEVMPWGQSPREEPENGNLLLLMGPCEMEEAWELEVLPHYEVRLPASVSESRDFARYESVFRFEGGRLLVRRRLQVLQSSLPANRRGELEAFQKVIQEDLGKTLVWERLTMLDYRALATNMSPDALTEAGRECLNRGHLQPALFFLQKAVEKEPKHSWAWNNLGRIYLSLGRLAEAEAAFARQIELNPRDIYAYHNLGLIKQKRGDWQEALLLFEKQLEITPLDRYALPSLANGYLQLKRWKEAEALLEKGIAADPQNQTLPVALGQAQLCQGRSEEAEASFEKALENGAYANLYNNIAYVLSQCGGDLARAERYAESAVLSLKALFRLQDNLKNWKKSLPLEWSLLEYLDTLGWIRSRKGARDEALPLIRTSFENKASGEVAAHLAILHGRRGEWPEARKYYREALRLQPGLPVEFPAGMKERLEETDEKKEGTSPASQEPEESPFSGSSCWRSWEGETVNISGPGSANDPIPATVYFACLVDGAGKTEDVIFFSGNENLQNRIREELKKRKVPPLAWEGESLKSYRAGKISFRPGREALMEWAACEEAFTEVWMMAMEAEGFRGY
jgi:tetratricopeptide (TPR) repeat protein